MHRKFRHAYPHTSEGADLLMINKLAWHRACSVSGRVTGDSEARRF